MGVQRGSVRRGEQERGCRRRVFVVVVVVVAAAVAVVAAELVVVVAVVVVVVGEGRTRSSRRRRRGALAKRAFLKDLSVAVAVRAQDPESTGLPPFIPLPPNNLLSTVAYAAVTNPHFLKFWCSSRVDSQRTRVYASCTRVVHKSLAEQYT